MLIHTLLEKCSNYGFEEFKEVKEASENQEWLKNTIKEIFADNLWDDENRKFIEDAIPTWLKISLVENVSFTDLVKSSYKSEFKFLIGAKSVNVSSLNPNVATLDKLITEATLGNEKRPTLKETEFNGFLTGSIDLIFCHAEKYYRSPLIIQNNHFF